MGNDSLDFVQRGKVSIVRRQYAEAVKICRLGLLGQPSLLEGRLVLGMALTALGRWDEVLAEMRVALETDPNAALAWLLKGEALVGKGDFQQAEQTLKRAKELDPSNSKADQLLAEIATARAAGFEGLPAEPTDTKVYPARVSGNADPELGNVVQPMPMDRGHLVQVPDAEEVSVEYEEDATEVDPDPSDQVNIAKKTGDKPASVLVDFGEGEDTVEDSQIGTEAFHKAGIPRRTDDSSYEGPATEDYGEHARPRVSSYAAAAAAAKKPGAGDFDGDEPSEDSTMTPAEIMRARRPTVRRAVDDLPPDGMEPSEPSIVLETKDLMIEQSREGFPRGFAPTFDTEDGEDEQTRQRRQRQVDEHAGTAPEAPEPVLHRQRPVRAPMSTVGPLPRSPQPTFPKDSSEVPTEMRGENGARGSVYGDGDGQSNPYGGSEDMPGVVRVPVKRKKPRTTMFVRAEPLPWVGDRSRRGIALLLTALIAVVAVGVATGLLVREWRMRTRVAKRHELAKQKLASGNYPGFQAAELLYRQILAERDDSEARAQRARVLAQMAFEFGDSTELAQRAMSSLGDDASAPCADKRPGCQDAAQARVYLAMARGELDRAGRLAQALRRKLPDAAASYLVGRAELLLERPDTATDALRTAAEGDAHNP
ncbi:MAG: Tetratricopeptide 2 repeat protein, partial [bacterium]|nr:Tetratricopeptide 2 repeat protein [bacterium]